MKTVIRIERNEAGRDFVAGDIHGCYRTLERALEAVRFEPRRDRLFSVGDLINRGPASMEALAWLTDGRIHAAVRGNHEEMFLNGLSHNRESAYEPWQQWIPDDEVTRWWRALRNLPLAITVETTHGDVGIIHAGPVHRSWTRMVAELERGSGEAIETALLGGDEGDEGAWRGERGTQVKGVRELITGHYPCEDVQRDGNWWCIDTGAGLARLARLTLARVDCEQIETTTVHALPEERGVGTRTERK